MFTCLVLLAQLAITVDVIYEIGPVDPSNIQEITNRRFFIKLMIGMVLYVQIAYGMFNKSVAFLSVIESDANKCMKFLLLAMCWFQMILSALVMTLVFRMVAKSKNSFEILGNAFGVIILNDFDDYAALFFKMYMEPFQNDLVNDDNFMKVNISQVSSVSSFFCMFVISVDSLIISDVMVLGTIDLLTFNGITSFQSFFVIIVQCWAVLLPVALGLLYFIVHQVIKCIKIEVIERKMGEYVKEKTKKGPMDLESKSE